MRVRDAIVVFQRMESRVGGEIVFLDELNAQKLEGILSGFAETSATTVAEEEFVNIGEDTDIVIVLPPTYTSHYIRLEPGEHKINVIGVGEQYRDNIKANDGTQLPELLSAIRRLEGVEVINPQGAAAKFIGGPATVIELKNINLKGC